MTEERISPCGDVLLFDGDVLTIDAPTPIEGLVPSAHRHAVLVVDGARYTLRTAQPSGPRTRYMLEREQDSLYDLPGLPLSYDPERHVTKRRERVATAAGWLVYVALAPLMPFLGLLPQRAKNRLVALGIDPMLSTGMSLGVEWFLCWPCVGIFLLTIMAEARWYIVLAAAFVPLSLVADLLYRWSGLQEDPPKHHGMLSVWPAFFVGVRKLARGQGAHT